jgi:hypothetical protein
MNEVYIALRNRLTNQVSVEVYDHAPQDLADGDYPYIRLDFPTLNVNDTDTELGFQAELQVISFSRYRGVKELNDLMDSVYNAYHRFDIDDTTNYCITNLYQVFRQISIQPDGLTRFGVQRFNLTFEAR